MFFFIYIHLCYGITLLTFFAARGDKEFSVNTMIWGVSTRLFVICACYKQQLNNYDIREGRTLRACFFGEGGGGVER